MILLSQIAAALGVPLPAGANRPIEGMAVLDEAGPRELSFLGSEVYVKQLATSRAGAVIASKRLKLPPRTDDAGPIVLVVENADLAAASALELFAPPVPRPSGIDPTARIDPSVKMGPGSAAGAHVIIGRGSRVGSGTILHPGVVIGQDVNLGDNCELFANVVLRERVTLGHRVIVHAGSVIGTDGFGYRWDGKQHIKIPQIGTVIIEDDVEIGSCVCIDRAKFSATRIGRGTKIDNLVQIGHNVRIGPNCIITGQAGLAGSATLGEGVVLGGQSAVRDHITMGDGAMLAACSGVMEDVPPKTIVSGLPALPHRQSLREQAALRRLPDLVVQVRKLQEQIDRMQKSQDDKA
jgi:UDP-3-O-[3-hydroxymyristoyl] glucosamine N-acyltransferase